jgi:DNA mismatch repair ATPase MutS
VKAFLMYRERDFDFAWDSKEFRRYEVRQLRTTEKPTYPVPTITADLVQDLELNTLFAAMSAGDPFLLEVCKKAVLTSLTEPEEILYRQEILKDCLAQPGMVGTMYGIAVEAVARERKVWGWSSTSSPRGVLHRSVEVLQIFVELLEKLRRLSDEYRGKVRSEGFTRFFRMIAEELSDEYIRTVEEHLKRLELRNGVVMSAQLGQGNQAGDYILRKLPQEELSWKQRVQSWVKDQFAGDSKLVYEVDPRDEAGGRALDDLRAQGISHVAAALAESTDHILDFFKMLSAELGFYVACLNVRSQMSSKGEPICFPEPATAEVPVFGARGLYDICLSLATPERVVSNDINADSKQLVMITGANRGGKSTFLRSIGLAQLMMQAGMFVPAESFRANVCSGIFTHFKREEDATMKSGKLDEELARMSSIIENLTTNSLVLCNESFASTNEREGSEIARQIIRALLECRVKVLYVTHLFDLTHSFHSAARDNALFLRAERLGDGTRTFRIKEGEPLPTSYGEDLYNRIFGDESTTTALHPN